ncbi:hypothetical protein BKA64DRAFT_585171 [Cadophora sp. MPI-SDFR-AT-0126]|nr:hypothetical protein BKA61DRAFT_495457 [Leptodontidium sp. MPI-SDFR-AT-0119]KAH7378987.1 hypothetical protein BKA64DRAFT_585171 [Leotiomycetes sp. MPI-SDFR-AT-0126]
MGSSTPNTNRGVWLSSYSTRAKVIDLPMPQAGPGSAVIEVLASLITPFSKYIHDGSLAVYNLTLPLVPNPGNIGRVQSAGPDSVYLKPGDLVYYNPWIKARDDPTVSIIQGHHGGEGPSGAKLMTGEWRDGSLQQYQKVPLEGLFVLDEARLCGELGYQPAELKEISLQSMVYAALVEAGSLQAGDTVIIGPATGTFSSIAVEVALILGANVIALGRSEEKLGQLRQKLGNPDRLKYVAMTGDNDVDSAAILKATPSGAGAEIFNDWSSGSLHSPPYFSAAFRAVKQDGRVVLSGAPSGTIEIPYTLAMHKNIKIQGKLMANRGAIESTIKLITSGVLKVGRKGGAEVSIFNIDQFGEAEDFAAKHGGWKNYTYITPNL